MGDNFLDACRDHIEQVRLWLEQNVKCFPTPDSVTLGEFEINLVEYTGSFSVTLDKNTLEDRFSFGLGGNGLPALYLPMFCSPLGAPASYATVDLTDETLETIKKSLVNVLPKMKPLGLNLDTGELVYRTTHSEADRRLDETEFNEKIERLKEPGFVVSRAVSRV